MEYQDKIDILEIRNKRYKQALEKIRDLAELEVMLDKNSKVFYPANIQRILDVINEVLK